MTVKRRLKSTSSRPFTFILAPTAALEAQNELRSNAMSCSLTLPYVPLTVSETSFTRGESIDRREIQSPVMLNRSLTPRSAPIAYWN